LAFESEDFGLVAAGREGEGRGAGRTVEAFGGNWRFASGGLKWCPVRYTVTPRYACRMAHCKSTGIEADKLLVLMSSLISALEEYGYRLQSSLLYIYNTATRASSLHLGCYL